MPKLPRIPVRVLRRVVALESAAPMLAVAAIAVIASTLPLLERITGPETARSE